ncbi:MAG: CopG family transcriptional regulator [Pseudomonadota bacterium]
MSTTTIRLPEALKGRVVRAAAQSGTTSHAFILQAIAEQTEQVERRSDFHAQAQQRMEKIAADGKALAWDEVRSYLQARAAGKRPAKPRARKI